MRVPRSGRAIDVEAAVERLEAVRQLAQPGAEGGVRAPDAVRRRPWSVARPREWRTLTVTW